MKLNHNSTSARLYRWFYMAKDMPQTLCPYFWKLVVMWVFILPLSIITAPLMVISSKPEDWFGRIVGGLLIWGLLFGAFLMLFPLTYVIWGWFSEKTTFGTWQRTGIFLWVLSMIIATVWGILELNKRRREKIRHTQREWIWDENGDHVLNPDYIPYEKKPNIIIEFIKATYNKYCPKIDWKNE